MKIRTFVLAAALAGSACHKKSAEPPPIPDASIDVAPSVDKPSAGVEIPMLSKHRKGEGTPKYTNRLSTTASPYLLRMSHSPIEFGPWDEAEFARARAANKLVMLSIGKGACADCEALATGAFDDETLAGVANDRYAAVAIDIDERPEVASFFTDVARTLGVTSLPVTVWATHEGDVVHAIAGPPSVQQLTEQAESYGRDAAAILKQAQGRTSAARQARAGWEPTKVAAKTLLKTVLAEANDPEAKPTLEFIQFEFRASRSDEKLVNIAMSHLDAEIASRYDVVGGGFFAPGSFEKRAADNGAFLRVLTEAWQRTQNPRYARLARRTAEFLVRELLAPNGAFYDSIRAAEPAFYTWTADALGEGNPGFDLDERGLPRLGLSLEKQAVAAGVDVGEFEKTFASALDTLRQQRAKRANAPAVVGVVFTGSNADVIDGLSYAGFALVNDDWINTAAKAAVALPVDGAQLLRSGIPGRLGPEATADDYARLIRGLLTLFEASVDNVPLRRAVLLQNQLEAKFAVPGGGYSQFPTRAKSVLGPMLVRESAANDLSGANMQRLDALRGDTYFAKRREELWAAMAGEVRTAPTAHGGFLVGTLLGQQTLAQVAVVGAGTEPLLDVLRSGYFPNVVLGRTSVVNVLSWVTEKRPAGDTPTAFVCRDKCTPALTEPRAFARELSR